MRGAVRHVDLAAEVGAGFVAGLIAAFFLLVFVSVSLTQFFSSGLLGRVVGVLAALNPTRTLLGKLLVAAGGGLGSYWRYVYTSRPRRASGTDTR